MNIDNRQIIEEFRTNEGKVGGRFSDAPLLLLTTIGRKSEQRHTTPLRYLLDCDRLIVFAANGGAPTHPAWYYNLMANPHVTVELAARSFETIAICLAGEEQDRLLARQAQVYPHFAEYQEKTTRRIPTIALQVQET